MEKFKELLKKYKHGWVFLYAFIYLPWFFYLEHRSVSNLHIIHSSLDSYIPFLEFFIVPYLLWFLFMAVTVGYFFLKNKAEFYQLVVFLFTGMTLFLIISTIYPNGLTLRPEHFVRDNIFTHLVQALYRTDTSTNVFPSIHVFNSIGAYIAIARSQELGKIKLIRYGSLTLTILIVMATMFLKQHSVVDVSAGIILAYILYELVYVLEPHKKPHLSKQLV